jgi:tRNA pseudouridine38-40 synthase
VPTVQGVLTSATRRLLGSGTRISAASRTDAGVHALRQVVSLTTEAGLPTAALLPALNAGLPPDIRVTAVADERPGFHARRQAWGKRYAYLIDNGAVADPLRRRIAWHVPWPLDVAAMRLSLVDLRGRHDFSAFCAAPGRHVAPECRLRSAHVIRRKQQVAVLLSADRFLHHMVRNIVGSVVTVGRGAREPTWLGQVLAGRDRRRAGPTAPAHGLVLVRVLYGGRAGAGTPTTC